MPRIIFKTKYLKSGKSQRINYVKYIATRDGVERIKYKNHFATEKQKQLISEILSEFPEVKELFEYEDYIQNGSRENASQFISSAMDYNSEAILTKKNYVKYIASRPRVEMVSENGMFTDADGTIDLGKLAEEVGNHSGNVWTHIISLRREDATRLGYDCADAWINICRAKRNEVAQQMSIQPEDLKWYAAFHNEGHHPHIHMIVFSKNERGGYVTKKSIANMRSSFAKDIFKQDLIQLYKGQTTVRDNIKVVTQETIQNLIRNISSQDDNAMMLSSLFLDLKNALDSYQGKKVYGFLPKATKEIVNKIIDLLAQDENITQLLEVWYMKKDDIYNTYRDNVPNHLSLSSIPEFKSLKNTLIHLISEMDTFMLSEEDYDPVSVVKDQTLIGIEPEGNEYDPSQLDDVISTENYIMEWSEGYKEAMIYFYGSEEVEKDLNKAKELFEREVEKRNVLAIYALGNIYERGLGVDMDTNISTQLFQDAFKGFNCIKDDSTNKKIIKYTNYRIGKMHLYAQGTEKNFEKARLSFENASDNIYAQYNLGCMYVQGQSVEINYATAFDYFINSKRNPYSAYKAAELIDQKKVVSDVDIDLLYGMAYKQFESMEHSSHDDNLQYRLGKMNYKGNGKEPDIEKAIEYLEKSVEMKNDNAKYLLAKIYLEIGEVEKIPQAISWLEELASKDIIYACNVLAKEYKEGTHIETNLDKAIFYYEKSAKQNDHFAEYALYKIYIEEEGYMNVPLALTNLEKAANSGFEIAQYHYGKYFIQGDFLEKNIDKGIEWLDKSASQGYQFAQYALGKLFLFGKEVPQDKEKAIYYLCEAAKQGNEYAIYLLEHMNDYHGQPTGLLTSRLFYHLQNMFAERMLADPQNPLLQVDKKLRQKIQQKRSALGHKSHDRSSTQSTV